MNPTGITRGTNSMIRGRRVISGVGRFYQEVEMSVVWKVPRSDFEALFRKDIGLQGMQLDSKSQIQEAMRMLATKHGLSIYYISLHGEKNGILEFSLAPFNDLDTAGFTKSLQKLEAMVGK